MTIKKNNLLLGAIYLIIAFFLFSSMSAMLKLAASELNTPMIVFLRNFFALIVLLPWLLYTKKCSLKTDRFGMHLIRSATGITAMYCFFWTIGELILADAILLSYSAPIFLPVFALLFLKEKVNLISLFAVGLGLFGIIIVLEPTKGIFDPSALVGVLAAIFASLAMISIRKMSDTEPAERVVFYFTFLCTLISATPAFIYWQPLTFTNLLAMMAAGFLAAFGQLFLTKGYSIAPPGEVAPFQYSIVLFGTGWGWLMWDEHIDLTKSCGFLVVCFAGIIASKANAKKKRLSQEGEIEEI
ncbi:MAG: DMT family transporter [Gammaproteobacteria bacterium]|nr:MAG: DMT family transporter [Gammaproteobacteria bacterium]